MTGPLRDETRFRAVPFVFFAAGAALLALGCVLSLAATAVVSKKRIGEFLQPSVCPRREQVPVAFDAVGPRRLVRQPGGTRCPAARPPFTPIGLTTVAHAAAPSPRISTVT